MAAHRLDRDTRRKTAAPSVRPIADHAFEILGGTTADGVDIAATFAAASVRMGDSVLVAYVPVDGRPSCRVRVSSSPVHSLGDRVDVTFILDGELVGRCRRESAGGRSGRIVYADVGFLSRINGSGDKLRGVSGRSGAFPDECRSAAAEPCGACDASSTFPGAESADGRGERAGTAVWPLPLSPLAAHIPLYPDGERLVALGMLAWMYGRDPDVVRRLLENELASRGGRVVSAALRLFELGWREAPSWVHCRFGPETGAHPVSHPAQRGVMDGRTAVVSAAVLAGVRRGAADDHPLARDLGRLFAEHGGRLEPPDDASPRPDAGTYATGRTPPEAVSREDVPTPEGSPQGGRCAPARASAAGSAAVRPLLVIDAVAGGDPADVDRRTGKDDVAGGSRAPRVIVRLARVADDGEPRFPAWFDPLGIDAACPAAKASVGRTRSAAEPIVLVPTTVGECFAFTDTAVRIAEQYRRDVIVLVDGLLLDMVQGSASGPHPQIQNGQVLFGPEALLYDAPSVRGGIRRGAVAPSGAAPANSQTPDASRPHGPSRSSLRVDGDLPDSAKAAVESLLDSLNLSCAPLETFVRPCTVFGGDEGDVLLVGWGATRGPVEEAVLRLRARGKAVSALHLRTLRPLPARLAETLSRFRHIVVVDVTEGGRDAQRRLRHVTALLRAASSAAERSGQRAERPLAERLSAHVFRCTRPMRPGAVVDFVLGIGGGRRRVSVNTPR